MNWKEEIIKCKEDIVYFIENYCTIDGTHIKLTNYQKSQMLKLNHANQQPSTSLTTCEGSETNG